MKRTLILLCVVLTLAGCNKLRIGPKGEGEYVMGSATVAYEQDNQAAMKKKAMKLAELDALEKAARVFLSSSSKLQYPAGLKEEILANPAGYVRRTYSQSSYRKGDQFYMEVCSMVLVSELSSKIKALEDAAEVKKTNIYVASRDLAGGQISINNYCRQGIYLAFKNQAFNFIDGGNLSQNNLDESTPIVDKAKKEGARFVIIADSSANALEAASSITTTMLPMRGRASIKVIAANNYQVIAEASGAGNGLAAVEEISVQQALKTACEQAAAQTAQAIDTAIHSAKSFTFVFKDVNTIDRLERLQNILSGLREVEDFSLTRYRNSDATFLVQAQAANVEELAAKIIRKHYASFSILSAGADSIEFAFI